MTGFPMRRGGDALPPPGACVRPSLVRILEEVRCMRLFVGGQKPFPSQEGEGNDPDDFSEGELDSGEDESDDEVDLVVAKRLREATASIRPLRGTVESTEPAEGARIEELKAQLFTEFGDSSLSGICPRDPPVRGPYGEAEIWLKPDAQPVSMPQFRLQGERREAHAQLVDDVLKSGKVEPGRGPWNTPSFPVPKKRPGEYRLVQDLRPQNAATLKDGHPLPLIEGILQRQGRFRMWSVLDLTDGYHQMPMKPEHRHITCMSTPRGTVEGPGHLPEERGGPVPTHDGMGPPGFGLRGLLH